MMDRRFDRRTEKRQCLFGQHLRDGIIVRIGRGKGLDGMNHRIDARRRRGMGRKPVGEFRIEQCDIGPDRA